MSIYKYIANRFLNLGPESSDWAKTFPPEYHTGYLAFKREVLETLHLEDNKDDFVFDTRCVCSVTKPATVLLK